MAAAPPTRAAWAAAVMEAASAVRTERKVRQQIMQIMHGYRPPRARDKHISVHKCKGCQLCYLRHQNVSQKGVLHIQLCNHLSKCPNDVMTQFWHQRERMQGARWHTVLAPTQAHARRTIWHGGSAHVRLAQISAKTNVSVGEEFAISEL